jgi:hypothetical protein
MTLDEFLALWLVLTIVVAYLGTVTLFCLQSFAVVGDCHGYDPAA